MNQKPKIALRKRLDNNFYVFIAFIAAAAVMAFVYYAHKLLPFGGITILRMDLYHQYGPMMGELYERITHLRTLSYSWYEGLGVNFLGNFSNYLASPLNIFIVFFGHENITEAISLAVLLRVGLSAATFSYFLKKTFGKHNPSIAAFGVLYAFCAHFIAYYWNIMWGDALVTLPLVILGVQKIVNEQKIALFAASFAMTLYCSYYMGMMTALFAAVYFIAYYFGNYSFTAEIFEKKPLTQSRVFTTSKEAVQKPDGPFKILRNSRFIFSGALFAMAAVLAAALAAFLLLPTFYALQACSATSGVFPQKFEQYFSVFNFFSNHLAGIDPTIRSSGSDVLPNVYSGMITIILVPLYLFCKNISIKQKIFNFGLLIFMFLSFNINYLNFIWHGMHFPNDLPFRFSFMYSFVLVMMAYQVFINIRAFSAKQIALTGAAVCAFIVFVEKWPTAKVLTPSTIYVSLAFAIIMSLILLLIKKRVFTNWVLATALLFCVILEAGIADTNNFQMDQIKTNFAGDFKDYQTMLAEIKNYDSVSGIKGDDGFYRLEEANSRTLNDPSWYNYNGVSTFSSMAYEKVANQQQDLGIKGNRINSYVYRPQTPVYNTMFSLKYIIENRPGGIASPKLNTEQLYKQIGPSSVGTAKLSAYENKYYLPIAFCADPMLANWKTTWDMNPFLHQQQFMEMATGSKTDLKLFRPLTIKSTDFNNLSSSGTYPSTTGVVQYQKISDLDSGSTNMVMHLDNDRDQNVYVYVKGQDVKRITASVKAPVGDAETGGTEYTAPRLNVTQQIDNEGYVLDLGLCKAGEQIEVTVPIEKGNISGTFMCYAAGFDNQLYDQIYNQLKPGAVNITSHTDTNIKGTFTASKKSVLYSSISYDKGWTVKIDGKKTEAFAINDALLAVDVTAGPHTVEYSFHPRGLGAGTAISGFAFLIALFMILFHLKFRHRKEFEKVRFLAWEKPEYKNPYSNNDDEYFND